MTDRVYKCTTKSPNSRRRKAYNAKDFRRKKKHHQLRPFMFHYLLFVCIGIVA